MTITIRPHATLENTYIAQIGRRKTVLRFAPRVYVGWTFTQFLRPTDDQIRERLGIRSSYMADVVWREARKVREVV